MPPHSLHSYDCVLTRETYMIMAGAFLFGPSKLQTGKQTKKNKTLHIFPHPIHSFDFLL